MNRGRGAVTMFSHLCLVCSQRLRSVVAPVAVLGLAACGRPAADMASPIEGVWELDDLVMVDRAGQATRSVVRASLFVFAPRHYSMMVRVGSDTNPPFGEEWNPTDGEKLASFNSLGGNAGRYKVSGSLLTIFPDVARNDVMGGREVFEFRVEGDTLRLRTVELVSAKGTPDPFHAGGGRTLMRLVRVR